MNTVRCKKTRPKRHRPTLSITIDPHALQGLKDWMKREGETNLSQAIQGFIECGIRDTCEGCPYYDELMSEDKEEGKGKAGVGKWTSE